MNRKRIPHHLSDEIQKYLLLFKLYDKLIGSICAIIAIFILAYVFLLPTVQRVQGVLQDKQLLAPRLDRLMEKESALNDINIPLYQGMVVRSSLILPSSKDYVSLFSTFDTLEVKTGVSLRGTDFQLGVVSTRSAQLIKSTTGAYSIPLQVSLVAQPEQIIEFIKRLSDFSGRYISISSIQWSNDTDGSARAQLSGEAYYLPLSTQIGSVDDPLGVLSSKQQELFTLISALPEPVVIESDVSVPTGKTNLFE